MMNLIRQPEVSTLEYRPETIRVIQCKDCKYYHKKPRMPHGWCEWHDSDGMRPEDFCSKGKEKEV